MTFSCDEKLPGFAVLDFFLLEETTGWPFVLTDVNSAQITLSPYVNNVEADIEPDSISVAVNEKQSAEGSVQQISISFRLITRSEALEQLLEQYANKPGIAIGKLNNEFKKMYGTNMEPLYLNYEVNDGSKIDGPAFTEVTIKGSTRKRPVYYTP